MTTEDDFDRDDGVGDRDGGKFFTPLQHRKVGRLPSTGTLMALCPSMDLIAFGLSTGSSRSSSASSETNARPSKDAVVAVNRVLSWQRIVVLSSASENDENDDDDGGDGDGGGEADDGSPTTCLCWSPDGRALAIGSGRGGARIFRVEDGRGSDVVHSVEPLSLGANDEDHHRPPSRGGGSDVSDQRRSRRTGGSAVAAAVLTSPAVTRSRAARLGINVERKQQLLGTGATTLAKRGDGSGGGGKRVHDPSVVRVLWVKFSPHPEAHLDDRYARDEYSWKLRRRYLDRVEHFLPSKKRNTNNPNESNYYDKTSPIAHIVQPSSKTTLSLFLMYDANGLLRIYLHGRYLIVKVPALPGYAPRSPPSSSSSQVNMVCSSDLTSVLLSENNNLTLYSIPRLYAHRHDLQQLSSSYCFIARQLRTISQGVRTVTTLWKNTFQPLDAKLRVLSDVFRDYGIVGSSPRAEIMSFILTGNDEANPALSHFFSNRLNELQTARLSHALETGAASAEATCRRLVSGPAETLVYVASELYGSSRCGGGKRLLGGDDKGDGPCRASSLRRSCERLYLITESCLADIVEFRHRLADFLRWLAGTLAAVKARETAVDSYERENARKKRVGQDVVARVAAFLRRDETLDDDVTTNGGGDGDDDDERSDTETLLGIRISEYFEADAVQNGRRRRGRKTDLDLPWLEGELPDSSETSVKASLESVKHLVKELFDQPCNNISKSVQRQDFAFAPSKQDGDIAATDRPVDVAIHHRVGLCEEGTEGGFRPLVAEPLDDETVRNAHSRHWLLVARPSGDIVQLVLIPGSGGTASGKFSSIPSRASEITTPSSNYYLSAFMRLPKECVVKEAVFYGDDGNSSLSSSLGDDHDKNNHHEGRQALVLLVERSNTSEELWLVKYDQLRFEVVYVEDGLEKIQISVEHSSMVAEVQAAEKNDDDDDDDDDNDDVMRFDDKEDNDGAVVKIQAKTRHLNTVNKKKSKTNLVHRRLVVSGSRGICGVMTDGSILSLFDLEEDEEAEESDNNDEEDDDYD